MEWMKESEEFPGATKPPLHRETSYRDDWNELVTELMLIYDSSKEEGTNCNTASFLHWVKGIRV